MDTLEIDVAISNLSKEYQSNPIFSNISLNIKRGEFVCIIGPSGCGKTTLLRVLQGLENKSTGKFTLHEKEIIEGAIEYGSSYIQQMPFLLPWRNLLQNVTIGIETKKAMTEPNIDSIIRLIKEYNLTEEDLYKYPHQLSGGMKQRVAILRALAFRPRILFCDEAFSSIDFVTRLHLIGIFKRNCREGNVTTIFVTHNIDEAIFLGDRVIVMSKKPSIIIGTYDTSNIGRFTDAISIRSTPDYINIFNQIFEKLNGNK